MQVHRHLVVFSDLDGTLLDHDSYSWDAAQPALDRLQALGIPVILASSKTAAEIARLQDRMGLSAYPAIVENGAGVLHVVGEERGDQTDYEALRDHLGQLPESLREGFTGFGDMTEEEVADMTGLPRDEAGLARMRQFSEPGIWSGTEAEKRAFLDALHARGLSAREGGRFLTLSFGGTKRDRMREIQMQVGAARSVALGDAPNDVEMLENADYGFIIANPHRAPLPPLAGEADGRIVRSTAPGPVGWNIAISGLLDRLDARKGAV